MTIPTRSTSGNPTRNPTKSRVPKPPKNLDGEGRLDRINVAWDARPWRAAVDHYAVHARPADGKERLVAKTVYPSYQHHSLGPKGQTWIYRIVTVNAAGEHSDPSEPVELTSKESVSASGRPLAVVGSFDGKGLEFALSPDGSDDYSSTFPDDVDFHYGKDKASTDWSYIHPGPKDKWAKQKTHRFLIHFSLSELPSTKVDLALWLIDSHKSSPGSAVLRINDNDIDREEFDSGAMRGSLEGDSTKRGSALKPSYIERRLPTEHLKVGENIFEIYKDRGSWIAYDAVGLFARRK